jgi:hypothetical protein
LRTGVGRHQLVILRAEADAKGNVTAVDERQN